MLLTNTDQDEFSYRPIIQRISLAILSFSDTHICIKITQIDPSSFTDLCTYLWCCVASAAKREGKPFDYTLMDFADSLTPETMAEWSASIMKESEGAEEKKRGNR
ncbi:MAG: hypothetical protein IKL83_02735 [Muribaculaceae bacterium]|nr:hypothetical protein [Muribaculaceae bacterium]